MPHIAYCTDRKDLCDQRQTALADHLAYIETILDRIAVAGPVASGPDGSTEASCFIYHTDDREEARQLLENDPYFKAVVYNQLVLSFLTPVGSSIAGKIF